MATLAEIEVVVRAVLAPFERDLAKLNQAVAGFERNATAGFTQAGQSVGLLNRQMGGTLSILRRMQGLIGLAMGAFAGNQLIQLANTWTDLNSRVNIAVGSIEQGTAVMDRLDKVARRTYSSMQLTVESFLGASSSLRQLGYSTKTQLDFTEALNNALVVSGAKGDRAAAVLNALSKAFAFGQLRGDELNSVLKVGGRVAEALAAGLGVTTNELRKMGAEGQLSTDKLIKALLSQLELLRKEADSMPATVGDAFVLMGNAMLKFVGSTAQASGVTTRLAQSIINLADNLKAVTLEGSAFQAVSNAIVGVLGAFDTVVNALFAHGGMLLSVLGTLGTIVLASRGAVLALTAAMWLLNAAMRANPFLLAVTAAILLKDRVVDASKSIATLGDTALAAWQIIEPSLLGMVNSVTNLGTQLGVSTGMFTSFGDFISKSVAQAVKDFSELLKEVAGVAAALDVAFANFPAALKAIVVSAINGAIIMLENFLNKIGNGIKSLFAMVGVEAAGIRPVVLAKIPDDEQREFAQSMLDAYNEAYNLVDKVASANAIVARNDAVEAARNRAAAAGVGDVDTPTAGQNTAALTKAQKAYQDLTKTAKDRIATLRNELSLVGQAPAVIERMRFQQELLNDAADKGGKVSKTQRLEIEELAKTYGALSSQLAAARMAQDVMQERVAMFGTAIQRVTQDLKARGVDIESEQGKWLAGQVLLNERLQEGRDIVGDFAQGLLSDLQAGVGMFEALANAAQKLQQRLLQMALDAAIDRLFSMLAGGLGGALGGGLSPQASALTGAGLFHSGGIVGQSGGPSRVVPIEAFRRAPRGHKGGGIDFAGGERPVIAKKGEVIGWPGQMKDAYGGGSKVTVQNIDQRARGAEIQTEQEVKPDGTIVIRNTIRDELFRMAGTPEGRTINLGFPTKQR